MVFGLILVAVGIIAILVKTDVITGSIWDYVWPTALVIIGLSFFFGRFRRHHRWWWFGGPPWDWDRGRWEDSDKPKKE
jgi:hypothetical protein